MAVLKNLCANGECCQLALDSVQRWSSSTTAFAAAVVLRPNHVHASTLMLCLLYISIIQIKSFHLDLSPHFQRGPVTRNLSSYNWVTLIWRWWEPTQCPVPSSSESTPRPFSCWGGVLGVRRVLLPAGNFVLQWAEERPDVSVNTCQTHPEGCAPAWSTRPTSTTDECEEKRRSHQLQLSTFFKTRTEFPSTLLQQNSS